MLKSGLIVGGATFVFVIIATLITPFCALCVAMVTGVGAGYLAGVFVLVVG